jgi:hypothetical protein
VKTVALVSAYREGALVQAAVRSGLDAMGQVLVFEGPAGPAHERGEPSDYSPFKRDPRVVIREGGWESDGGKRTAMVEWCRRYDRHAPTWGIWLDGDEVMLWPELLRDYLVKAHELHPDAVSMSVKLVELDGAVYDCAAKCIRLDLVGAVLESSYQLQMKNGAAVLSLPNTNASAAPVPGMPHLFHRHFLRPEGRRDDRLHKAETKFFEDRTDPRVLAAVEDA